MHITCLFAFTDEMMKCVMGGGRQGNRQSIPAGLLISRRWHLWFASAHLPVGVKNVFASTSEASLFVACYRFLKTSFCFVFLPLRMKQNLRRTRAAKSSIQQKVPREMFLNASKMYYKASEVGF